MMKQTLESPYSYGSLSLNGENIRFTSVKQIFSQSSKDNQQDSFTIQINLDTNRSCKLKFQSNPNGGLKTIEAKYCEDYSPVIGNAPIMKILSPEMTREEIIKALSAETRLYEYQKQGSLNYEITNFFCYLICIESDLSFPIFNPTLAFSNEISRIIHVKGMRSNLERTYKLLDINTDQTHFPAAFDNYIGSLINSWSKNDVSKIESLNGDLKKLNLSKKVEAKSLDDTQIELKVSRTLDSEDMVNIVDVGSGVS